MSEAPHNDLTKAFAQRANQLGLQPPQLPFPTFCMDGELYDQSVNLVPVKKFPTAAEDYKSRLQHMGKIWTTPNSNVLEFIDTEGKFHIARKIPANRDALLRAGYRRDSLSNHYSLNTDAFALTPENEVRFAAMMNTPRDEQERLEWAIEGRSGFRMADFRHALKNGADAEKATLKSNPAILYLFQRTYHVSRQNRDEMIRQLLPHSPHEDAQGNTLLHKAMSTRCAMHGIIPHLLQAGINPFARNERGLPALLRVSDSKNKRTVMSEVTCITDAMLKTEGLSEAEKRLIQKHCQIIDYAFINRHETHRLLNKLQHIWEIAHDIRPDDTAKIPTQVQALLASFQEEKDFARFHEYFIGQNSYNKLVQTRDLLNEFVAHVILPQCLMEYFKQVQAPVSDQELNNLAESAGRMRINFIDALRPVATAALFKDRSIEQVVGLSEAWHDPNAYFPDALIPLKARGEWHPLTENKRHENIRGLKGIYIQVLTTSDELEKEGKIMRHCVGRGSYGDACLKGKTHIISIRREGVELPLSTVEIKSEGIGFSIVQNRGISNHAPPAEAVKAAKWFIERLNKRQIAINASLGETPESKILNARPSLLKTVGFELTQSNINAAFREYRRPARRALQYNPSTKEFDVPGGAELIAGMTETDLRSYTFSGGNNRRVNTSFVIPDEQGKIQRTLVANSRLPVDIRFEETGLLERAMKVFEPLIEQRRAKQGQKNWASTTPRNRSPREDGLGR